MTWQLYYIRLVQSTHMLYTSQKTKKKCSSKFREKFQFYLIYTCFFPSACITWVHLENETFSSISNRDEVNFVSKESNIYFARVTFIGFLFPRKFLNIDSVKSFEERKNNDFPFDLRMSVCMCMYAIDGHRTIQFVYSLRGYYICADNIPNRYKFYCIAMWID